VRLVVSPHLDDAVFGCGEYLTEIHDPVLTVFAGAPPGDVLTDYDHSCGFSSSRTAMQTRWNENAAALNLLGCSHGGLGLLDRQYDAERPSADVVARALFDAMTQQRCEGLLAPLGIQHPDHVLVSDAALQLAITGTPVWLYEELPYRVIWPEAAIARFAEWMRLGWRLVPDFLGAGDAAIKEKAIGCYASQQVNIHCCLVPERFWAVTQ
jgi:LmbE family N-acetylglucosaminyl deacetylase